jgi:hypothetical protein
VHKSWQINLSQTASVLVHARPAALQKPAEAEQSTPAKSFWCRLGLFDCEVLLLLTHGGTSFGDLVGCGPLQEWQLHAVLAAADVCVRACV